MTVLEQWINCGVPKQVPGKENCLLTDAGEPVGCDPLGAKDPLTGLA